MGMNSEAAVPVAVHKSEYERNTASPGHFKCLRSRSLLLSVPGRGDELKKIGICCGHGLSLPQQIPIHTACGPISVFLIAKYNIDIRL